MTLRGAPAVVYVVWGSTYLAAAVIAAGVALIVVAPQPADR